MERQTLAKRVPDHSLQETAVSSLSQRQTKKLGDKSDLLVVAGGPAETVEPGSAPSEKRRWLYQFLYGNHPLVSAGKTGQRPPLCSVDVQWSH